MTFSLVKLPPLTCGNQIRGYDYDSGSFRFDQNRNIYWLNYSQGSQNCIFFQEDHDTKKINVIYECYARSKPSFLVSYDGKIFIEILGETMYEICMIDGTEKIIIFSIGLEHCLYSQQVINHYAHTFYFIHGVRGQIPLLYEYQYQKRILRISEFNVDGVSNLFVHERFLLGTIFKDDGWIIKDIISGKEYLKINNSDRYTNHFIFNSRLMSINHANGIYNPVTKIPIRSHLGKYTNDIIIDPITKNLYITNNMAFSVAVSSYYRKIRSIVRILMVLANKLSFKLNLVLMLIVDTSLVNEIGNAGVAILINYVDKRKSQKFLINLFKMLFHHKIDS